MSRLRGWHFLTAVFFLAGAVFLTRPAAALAPDAPSVLGVRVAAHNDGVTRLVLDLSEKVAFSVSPAAGDRVVVDLPELDWRAQANSLHRPVGLLKNFHFSKSGPGASQLVLDTKGGATVGKAFLIPPVEAAHYRLVLDLGTTPAGAPADTQPAAKGEAPIPVAMPAPTPARRAKRPPAPPPATPVKPVVVIDPGHGGVDPGAISVSGAYEKNIVLALAHDVKEQLDRDGKVKCVLTRERDIFIPLRERVAIARAANAGLFISLHADTVDNAQVRGLSVYTLSQTASDTEAQALADKENKADIVAGIDLSNEAPEVTNILIDLVQRESMNLSARFAVRVIREVEHDTHNVLEVNTHRFAGFAVLKAPDVPSVLIETGYLSNARDEQMLRRPEYRAKLAAALARAIEGYFADTHRGRRT